MKIKLGNPYKCPINQQIYVAKVSEDGARILRRPVFSLGGFLYSEDGRFVYLDRIKGFHLKNDQSDYDIKEESATLSN